MYHTLSYSRVTDLVIDNVTQNDSAKIRITHPNNLKQADVLSYSLFLQKDLTKWFSFSLNATVYEIICKGYLNDLSYSSSTVGFNPTLFGRFILPKDTSIELNAYYQAPVLEGVNHVKSRSSIDIGFKKLFMNKKLSFSLAFSDTFFARTYNTYSKYQNLNNVSTSRMDTRRVSLSLNYTFGRLKLQQREVNSNDEEKNRTNR